MADSSARRGSSQGSSAWPLVAVSVPGLLGERAQAAAGGDGSDWGQTGLLTSNSAVTVRWDNADNPASSVVPRDGRQRCPTPVA